MSHGPGPDPPPDLLCGGRTVDTGHQGGLRSVNTYKINYLLTFLQSYVWGGRYLEVNYYMQLSIQTPHIVKKFETKSTSLNYAKGWYL